MFKVLCGFLLFQTNIAYVPCQVGALEILDIANK